MTDDQFESFRQAVNQVGTRTSQHLTAGFNVTAQVIPSSAGRQGIVLVRHPAGHLRFTINPREEMFTGDRPVGDRVEEMSDDILAAVVAEFLENASGEGRPAQ